MKVDRYCSYCGTKIRENGNFCEGCGRKILSEEMQKKQMEEKLRNELKEEIKKEFEEEQKIKENEVKSEYNPLSSRNIGIDLGFSLILAVGIMAFSILIGVIIFGYFDNTKQVVVTELGLPLQWFKTTNNEMAISSWLNLFGDYVFYTLILFVILLGYEILYKKKKSKEQMKKDLAGE